LKAFVIDKLGAHPGQPLYRYQRDQDTDQNNRTSHDNSNQQFFCDTHQDASNIYKSCFYVRPKLCHSHTSGIQILSSSVPAGNKAGVKKFRLQLELPHQPSDRSLYRIEIKISMMEITY